MVTSNSTDQHTVIPTDQHTVFPIGEHTNYPIDEPIDEESIVI